MNQMMEKNEILVAKLEKQGDSMTRSIDSLPCFRCDGRRTEKDQQTTCRRCKGTGIVNTLHEKAIKQLIDY